ncbi:FPL domain-containing protein [Cephalotus follicularis]|uniref:FPL domain-containing protein n=1 Tax=Cephalotus follicularis TaxID=3775 RepID=A0A1Q3AVE6_CEPFO|nr:FPL domain-containing protein [Cephalotus follicularis]
MWFSFWKPRDRFSLEELRYLTDQLQKTHIVNEVNKDFVVEALRSIAELLTYGDQHDSSFFEFFMERQVMGDFARLLKINRTVTVSLQLLQTMSIMIQNLKSEHAIYYMFSNEHINYLITYPFDFHNEELLSYYISFLRAISGKLNKNTISLLVKTCNDVVVSFPLYVEAIRFAFHEESMIRIAVRAVTLNVYHVGDDSVNTYITRTPHADYFSNLVSFFRKQCIDLNGLVSYENPGHYSTSTILSAVDEIEDNLFYFSDVISAGIPDVGRLITDNILHLLILPLLLLSAGADAVNGIQIGAVTSLYLLCCILRIVKIKDLANIVAVALFCLPEAFILSSEVKLNGSMSGNDFTHDSQQGGLTGVNTGCLRVTVPNVASSSQIHPEDMITPKQTNCGSSHFSVREALLSYITCGNDVQALGSLSVLATLLQTKELEESMLDALGILPQRKQHKKLLLQALVGEGSGEDQLFSSESCLTEDSISNELDGYLQKLKEQYGVLCSFPEVGTSPRIHRHQVLDALVHLFCRSNISAETLWVGGWLLRQLLPYSEAEFNSQHLKLLKDSFKKCTNALLEEMKGIWCDLLVTVLCEEWKRCKRAIEASSPQKDPKCILFPSQKASAEDGIPSESSFIAGERMCELVKVFVLLHQLQSFSLGRALPDQPPIRPPANVPENSRATTAGLDISGPKPNTEIRLVDAVPCRIAFERGKERHFCFLAVSMGTSGWVILAEELPLKQQVGVLRVAAPLAGSNPRIDDKHSRWLHLRIRPSTLPLVDPAKPGPYSKVTTKALVDGRWTLAFGDEESCKFALSMILEEINIQSNEVMRRLKPLLDLERVVESSNSSLHPFQSSRPSNSL